MVTHLSSLRDEELVALCCKQLPYKTIAFELLLERYEAMVFRSCLHYLANVEDAEEVCQDVFMRVFHHISSFEGRSAFRTWLFRITYNLSSSKQSNNMKRTSQEKNYHIMSDGRQEGLTTGLATEALQKLSDHDRRIILMRYISELKLLEIAETLEIGLSAVKMRLQRAVEKFRISYDYLVRREG